MLVCVDTPLPENVRTPVSAGPVSVEIPATVTPWPATGRVELLNMIVVGARKRKRPVGSPPITTLGVASRVVPAVFLLRDTRVSSRMPHRGETLYFTPPPRTPATVWASRASLTVTVSDSFIGAPTDRNW